MAAVDESMAGKIVLITGATQGIGRATAQALGRRGAELCLVVRDEARGNEVASAIGKETGKTPTVIVADLSLIDETKRAAAAFKSRFHRLDVLINNAGGIFPTRKVTKDGFEHTFALNHLGYFGLTCLLRPLLEMSAPARVINVSSAIHARGKIDFDDIGAERDYAGMKAYAQSKLANVFFTYELARRLAGTGVTANCLHPGVVRTGFGKGEPGWLRVLVKMGSPFMISEDEGAKTSIFLASSPDVEGVTGAYYVKCRRRSTTKVSYDADIAKKLWETSEAMTGILWQA